VRKPSEPILGLLESVVLNGKEKSAMALEMYDKTKGQLPGTLQRSLHRLRRNV
jgi:hypothetical protein